MFFFIIGKKSLMFNHDKMFINLYTSKEQCKIYAKYLIIH